MWGQPPRLSVEQSSTATVDRDWSAGSLDGSRLLGDHRLSALRASPDEGVRAYTSGCRFCDNR